MNTNDLENQAAENVGDSVWRGVRQRLLVIAGCTFATLALGGFSQSATAQSVDAQRLSGSSLGSLTSASLARAGSGSGVSRSRSDGHQGSRRIRGRRSSHRSYRSGYRHRSYFYGSVGFGYYPYGYWSYGYRPYGYGYGYGPYGYGYDYYYRGNAGALDLDIKPEEAQIYVDGELAGIADNYDGFPRYLWLEAGTHNIVIYHEGLETLGKQIKLEPGVVVRLKDRMVPGEAKSAEEMYAQLGPLPEAKRGADDSGEARLAPWRFSERDRDGSRGGDEASSIDADSEPRQSSQGRSARSSESWRQRGGGSRAAERIQRDFRAQAGEVTFDVVPTDAVIYLDGRLVGSGGELAEQDQPLLVDPGRHMVEVTRPGYVSVKKEFSVDSGVREAVQVKLEKN